MASPLAGFPEFLANTLRVEDKIRVYHTFTPQTASKSLFSALPAEAEEDTTCESHFLAVSQICAPDVGITSNGSANDRANSEIFILGIEILVFDSQSLKTIFVSKADSTGLVSRPASTTSAPSSSIIRNVICAFIEWLVNGNLSKSRPLEGVTNKPQLPPSADNGNAPKKDDVQHPDHHKQSPSRKKLVLSLFARSQNQYLFPGSIENSTKHVLDDRQLIKWWCRLLDRLVQKEWLIGDRRSDNEDAVAIDSTSVSIHQEFPATSIQSATRATIAPEAYVIVPGCDRTDTARLFFPHSSSTPPGQKWQNIFPIQHLARSDSSNNDRNFIPARCFIPRFPDDPKSRFCDDLDAVGTDDKGQWKSIQTISQFWEMMEYRQECAAGRLVGFIWIVFEANQATTVPEEAVRLEHANGNTTKQIQTQSGYVEGTDVRLPPSAPGSILLSSEQYVELSDLLINDTDFAGLQCAIDSTRKWIEKVKDLSGQKIVGIDVQGRRSPSIVPSTMVPNGTVSNPEHLNDKSSTEEAPAAAVNTLVGIRKKKRNADVAGIGAKVPAHGQLDGNQSSTQVEEAVAKEQVNTLTPGLVRKKPKIL